MDFPPVSQTVKTNVLIIGGGVAGLAAARELKKNKVDFLLLELESETGGNARGGKNAVSAYPLGAHYLPLPDQTNKELLELLQENGTITGITENGNPIYNELHLTFAPQERLFINTRWQNDLVPEYGLSSESLQQIERFEQLMDGFRKAIGSDGNRAFAIPLDRSSSDEQFRRLDKLTMLEWLKQQNLNAEELIEYVNYCCRDDYGTTVSETSAWAGIHYYASRHNEDQAHHGSVITFPEGNSRLVSTLRKSCEAHIRTQQMAIAVRITERSAQADVFDVTSGKTICYEAENIILAVPQFIASRLLGNTRKLDTSAFSYAPWMVANITATAFYDNGPQPLSWDNVIHGSKSLGYVNACHQSMSSVHSNYVFTIYWPLSHKAPAEARREASEKTHAEWCEMIIAELEQAHPGVRNCISNIDVWLWGHGMIRPVPGFIWGEARRKAAVPLGNRICFAHSDLSGISIFEEAFYSGIRAANFVAGKDKTADA
jgi:phytoene dehydrogenase-like protein